LPLVLPLFLAFFSGTLASNTLWTVRTQSVIKRLYQHYKNYQNYLYKPDDNKHSGVSLSHSLYKRLCRNWQGDLFRSKQRKELIEPVQLIFGLANISKLLTYVNKQSVLLNLSDLYKNDEPGFCPILPYYKAYLIDESKRGCKIKLNAQLKQSIYAEIGELLAIKYQDDTVYIGFLRWIRETHTSDIELGIEHLTAKAEPVVLKRLDVNRYDKKAIAKTEFSNLYDQVNETSDYIESFIFPGGKKHLYKPVLFTHTFVENYYNIHTQRLCLIHKTGTLNIKLVKKINELLDYSLYLFEKIDS